MAEQDISIAELVSKIERGEIRLPEMQRLYVWKKTQVRDLLDSLYRGYPTGSILTWDNQQAETRKTQLDANAGNGRYQLLLDGQQRLYSLHAVLRGEKVQLKKERINILFNLEHPDTLDILSESQGDDYDENADASDATGTSKRKLIDNQAFVVEVKNPKGPHWVSVSDVFKSHGDREILEKTGAFSNKDLYDKYSERIRRLRSIKDYKYRVVILGESKSYEEVTEIFVRINSLGTKLRGSDLAFAEITAKWNGFSLKIEEYENQHNSEVFTLGTSTLIRNLIAFATGESKFKLISKLTTEQLKSAWEAATKGMDLSLQFLDGWGIKNSAVLTSPYIAIVIAYFANCKKYKISREEKNDLKRWALLVNAKGRYSRGSSETILDQDLSNIRQDAAVEPLFKLLVAQFGRDWIEETEIEGKTSRSSYFKTMFLAFREQNAFDWRTATDIQLTRRSGVFALEYHHIFPKKLLTGKYHRGVIDDISNLAFISGITNRGIGAKQPAEYFPKIIEKQGQEALERQCIPTDPALWRVDAFELFLEERRKLITKCLNKFLNAQRQ